MSCGAGAVFRCPIFVWLPWDPPLFLLSSYTHNLTEKMCSRTVAAMAPRRRRCDALLGSRCYSSYPRELPRGFATRRRSAAAPRGRAPTTHRARARGGCSAKGRAGVRRRRSGCDHGGKASTRSRSTSTSTSTEAPKSDEATADPKLAAIMRESQHPQPKKQRRQSQPRILQSWPQSWRASTRSRRSSAGSRSRGSCKLPQSWRESQHPQPKKQRRQ